MKTINLTPQQMAARTARFAQLQPYSQQQSDANGIPTGAMEKLTAHRVYPVMVPDSYTGRSENAPVRGGHNVVLTIAECPPGNGPGLHCHETTTESFFCLSGRFRIGWGDNGENGTILEPLDFVSVPPGVSRDFKNLSDETGRLLVIIETNPAEPTDRIAYSATLGEEVVQEFGPEARQRLEAIGFKFNAGQPE
jgi:uncharacterized RmlC-like cupin family protein